MGVNDLASRHFAALLVSSANPGASRPKRCGFRRVLPVFANTGLLNSHRPLDGGAGRALTGTLVRRPVLLNADPEVGGQLVGVAVGQRGICALDAAQCGDALTTE